MGSETPTKPAALHKFKSNPNGPEGIIAKISDLGAAKMQNLVSDLKIINAQGDAIGDELLEFFLAADDLPAFERRLGAWDKVRKAIGNTTNGGFTKFATDIPTLESVSKMIADGSSFRNKVGSNWEQVLDDIISMAKDGPCSSCGGAGRVGRTEMGAYLDDVDHFIKNFEISSGSKGETFYNWMRGATNPNPGQLDELHQTLSDFAKRNIKEADVVGIGKQFPNGAKKYDLRRIGDKYTEYKNKDFVSSPLSVNGSDVDQLINGYIKNINKIDDLEWKAGLAKLKDKGWTESNALTNMKSQWKNVFSEAKTKNNLFDAIWGNSALKQNTFGSLSETQARAILDNWVSTTDDALFKFIKVE